MKNIILLPILSLALLSFSCEKDNKPLVVLPENLTTSIQHVSGDVTVTVSANNANFYSVVFYENGDSTFVTAQDGVATYTFQVSGTYTIKSRAHSTDMDFIEKTEQVTVFVDPGNTSGAPTSGYTSPASYAGMTLVWSDEFNGTELSTDWTFDIGTGSGGWGNNELQYYTNQNHTVGGGFLEIKAKSQTFNASEYTSTRLKTQGLKSWKYGRIDVRAALPYGQGIWPAIWMLGDNITSVSWPACGEIDIMEMIGGEGYNDRTVHGTAHWADNGHAQYGQSTSLPAGKLADEFHVFSIVWDQNSIKWYMDNVQYNQLDITPATMSAFHENFFLILNLAVGGNWPGNPIASTVFPQSMFIDYVRVFQ